MMMTKIIPDRLSWLESIELKKGKHKSIEGGACAMEAVAYITGEEFSDHPSFVSPIIASFLRSWNDSLKDDDRNRIIKPLLLKTIGTSGNKETEERRFWMIIDWAIRIYTPAWLELANLSNDAYALRSLAEITGTEGIENSLRHISVAKKNADAARNAAWDAAWCVARDAAWCVAWDAAWDAVARDAAWCVARDAAWCVARDAAWCVAWDAAWDAAWCVARDAAWCVARAAAGEKLSPVTARLRKSASALVIKMCELSLEN